MDTLLVNKTVGNSRPGGLFFNARRSDVALPYNGVGLLDEKKSDLSRETNFGFPAPNGYFEYRLIEKPTPPRIKLKRGVKKFNITFLPLGNLLLISEGFSRVLLEKYGFPKASMRDVVLEFDDGARPYLIKNLTHYRILEGQIDWSESKFAGYSLSELHTNLTRALRGEVAEPEDNFKTFSDRKFKSPQDLADFWKKDLSLSVQPSYLRVDTEALCNLIWFSMVGLFVSQGLKDDILEYGDSGFEFYKTPIRIDGK